MPYIHSMLFGERIITEYGECVVTRIDGHRISTVAAADIDDALREQLEYLLEYKHMQPRRYGRVRAELLKMFEEP